MLLVNSLCGSERGYLGLCTNYLCCFVIPSLSILSLACLMCLCVSSGFVRLKGTFRSLQVTKFLRFFHFPLRPPLFLYTIEKCLYACLIFGNVVLSWLSVILLATAFSSPGQQQNVNEDALNEPAFAALSLLAGRANMFPVGERPQLYGQTMCLALG